ncbi:retinol dehydrogenase 12-like isoform X1 [Haliotis rufescens]|uniref:retinol dehydrogenase 12-like isoform X1 n=2 Tax=Haliotis rufescens TaxID=6454 RepID=UPI00201EDE7F|nr:retinol dehydrogenase 12-like isoform X1 [Haliotis rufescens]XP_048259620.1 retinol dehydrogenase 12-like isoform X1 [Haliotis rufescens]
MESLEEMWRSLVGLTHSHHILMSSVLGVGFGYILLRQWLVGSPVRSQARMDGKTVLITGGNTGIGKATAQELMKRGARVIIACRDVVKGAAALKDIHVANSQNQGACKLLDLASFQSIRSFVDNFLQEEKKLDVLINNAAVAIGPRLESRDGYEMQFAVNHLGHFLLTNLLLDVMKKSAPSRIINVSSKGYAMGKMNFDDINSKKEYKAFDVYAKSKLANVLFTRELSSRLRGSGVTVNCLHPGVVYTEIGRNVTQLDFNWLIKFLLGTVGEALYYLFANTPKQGARTTVYCAVAPEMENISGKFLSDSRICDLLPHAMDADDAERLWCLSEEMVKLKKQE